MKWLYSHFKIQDAIDETSFFKDLYKPILFYDLLLIENLKFSPDFAKTDSHHICLYNEDMISYSRSII